MNPNLTQVMMAFLAGHGLSGFASSLEKLKKTLSGEGGTVGAKRPLPPAVQALMQAQAPPQAPPVGGAGAPPNMATLSALLASRGGA